MDGFQSLRCLWKHVDKTVQSIMLKLGMYGVSRFVLILNKTVNYGRISQFKVCMEAS